MDWMKSPNLLCFHARAYCPEGCHDYIVYDPPEDELEFVEFLVWVECYANGEEFYV